MASKPCPQCATNVEVPANYFSDSIQCPSCGLQVSLRVNATPAAQYQPQPFQAQPVRPSRPMPQRPAPRPAPQYAQPQHVQPQYAQPRYSQPQYAQPQYGAPQPYPAQYAPGYAYAPPRSRKGLWWLLLIPAGIVGILALAAIPLIAGGSKNVDEWPMHRSVSGGYEVRMPRAPDETTDTGWTELGLRTFYTATVISGLRTYEVTWFDLGPGSEDDYYYDSQAGAEGVAEAIDGRVTSLEPATVSGYPAHLCRISAKPGGFNGMYYLLRVGNRVYLVGAANFDSDDEPVIRRYMDTFRVTR